MVDQHPFRRSVYFYRLARFQSLPLAPSRFPTSAVNGLGECERCNYAKEAPGWRVTSFDESGTHTAEFITATGAHYRSTAPPLPGAPMIAVSEVEIRIGIELADLHAA